MNVFFDVDYTLIADDGSLRPYVHEVFQKIKDDGHNIYIWSGVGIRWEVVNRHNLRQYIETCYLKPLSDYKETLIELGVDVMPDFVIDDHSGVPLAFGGVVVRPYYTRNETDEELLRVYDELKNFKKA
ncbi:MAG: HAD hydrolase family protein [Chloroflexi bacterium]|nr:HAD hydrolase family protein [Chloroflexota bacterium]